MDKALLSLLMEAVIRVASLETSWMGKEFTLGLKVMSTKVLSAMVRWMDRASLLTKTAQK